MTIEAKVSLISLLEKRMADTLTVQQMEKLTGAAADILDGFDVQEIAREDDGPDDLLQIYVSALKVEGRSQKTIDRYICHRENAGFCKGSDAAYHCISFAGLSGAGERTRYC